MPLFPTFVSGTVRAVLCVGPFAFKLARSRHGALCNRYEADLYNRSSQERRALLCPPLWCSPGGLLLVMRRARPMTQSEYGEHVRKTGLMLAWDYRGPGDDGYPFEPKPLDWGWLDGRPVALDYANLGNVLPNE
jgi:hypothetical protein